MIIRFSYFNFVKKFASSNRNLLPSVCNMPLFKEIHTNNEEPNQLNILHKQNVSNTDKSQKLIRFFDNFNIPTALTTSWEETQTNNQADELTLFFEKCRYMLIEANVQEREQFSKQILSKLEKENYSLTVEHYNTFIKINVDSHIYVNYENLLNQMTCAPNDETFKLLLENVCVHGLIDDALKLLNIMKDRRISLDEQIFNSLILCHTIQGGLQGGKDVLKTMKVTQIAESEGTYWSLLQGLASRRNEEEFKRILYAYKFDYDEQNFFKLVYKLAVNNNQDWIKMVKTAMQINHIPRESNFKLELLCKRLIRDNDPLQAFNIYYELAPPISSIDYGMNLLRYMVIAKAPSKVIVEIAKELKERNLNELALENTTEIAFIEKEMQTAWDLLKHFDHLRRHYFWPLLKHESKCGEIGIFLALAKMISYGVLPDCETLEDYCLPVCDLHSSNELLVKFKKEGIPTVTIVSSILTLLLRRNMIREAVKFYENNTIPLNDQKTIITLSKTWFNTNDTKQTTLLLQLICENSKHSYDSVGLFMIQAFKICKRSFNIERFLKLAEYVSQNGLKITNTTSDEFYVLFSRMRNFDISGLEKAVESLTDIALRKAQSHMPHPNDMTLDQMECHLIELQSKGMETRGILRKLIQEHARIKSYERMQELRLLFLKCGYKESGGMKAALLQSHIQNHQLELALNTYKEIKSIKNFSLDSFKILDMCSLLVKNDQFDNALEILQTESINRSFLHIETFERNCKELLNCTKSPEEINVLFEVLVENCWCKPSNVILGPLVKIYLQSNNTEMAAKKYVELAEKYKCTPMQLEVLSSVVVSKNAELLEKVVNVTANIHGGMATRCALAAALAENRMFGPLQKLFTEGKRISDNELEKRYERWIIEGKIEALQTMLKSCEKFPPNIVNKDSLYLAIIRCYSLKNDYNEASKFMTYLEEKEALPNNVLQKEYNSLAKRCNLKTAQA